MKEKILNNLGGIDLKFKNGQFINKETGEAITLNDQLTIDITDYFEKGMLDENYYNINTLNIDEDNLTQCLLPHS